MHGADLDWRQQMGEMVVHGLSAFRCEKLRSIAVRVPSILNARVTLSTLLMALDLLQDMWTDKHFTKLFYSRHFPNATTLVTMY